MQAQVQNLEIMTVHSCDACMRICGHGGASHNDGLGVHYTVFHVQLGKAMIGRAITTKHLILFVVMRLRYSFHN